MSNKIEKITPEAMSNIGKLMDAALNEENSRDIGFAVLVFPTGEKGKYPARYVSNCERLDMIKAVQEWLDQTKIQMN